MAFSEDFLSQVKQYNDIEAVMASYVNLKRRGRTAVCLCPFHSEKTPSCVVHPDEQYFHCFGCGAGGDVITFIMRMENLEYPEAVRFLAEKAGLAVPDDGVDDRAQRLKMRILEINRETARYFNAMLLSEAGRQGLDYLHKRGLTDQTVTRYGLGYSLPDWQALHNHLHRLGYSDEELLAAGVIAKGKNGGGYDMFRGKVMFPIIDLRGNVIGFGGRKLEGDGPKYINSPETPVYNKRRELFSLNFAKNTKDRLLILAEGYMDVISMYQAGFHNVIATLGTAITKEQARLIARYANEVIITYDSDEAGQNATHKAVALLDEVGIRARVISMEGAKDPDEYIKAYGAARFKLLLDGARSAVDFALGKAKAQLDMETEAGKVDFLKRAVAILSGLQNPLEREVYCAKIALELGIDKKVITMQVEAWQKRKRKSEERKELLSSVRVERGVAAESPEAARHPKRLRAEEGIIACLFRNPDSLDSILSRIKRDDFSIDFHRRLFDSVANRLKNGQSLDMALLGGEFSPDEMGRISGMMERFDTTLNMAGQIEDYIQVILEQKGMSTAKKAADMTEEDLLRLSQLYKNKKSSKP